MPDPVAPRPDAARPSTPRACLAAACVLAFIGLWRFASDMLTDGSWGWWKAVDGTWLRYTVRAPSDGSFWGDLNAQWFKILAVPCGISCVYLARRLMSMDLRETQSEWASRTIRLLYVGAIFVIITICEIEKKTHVFGLKMAGVLPGEVWWLNNAIHSASAIIGWYYARWLRFLN